jgi:hypothetical protein
MKGLYVAGHYILKCPRRFDQVIVSVFNRYDKTKPTHTNKPSSGESVWQSLSAWCSGVHTEKGQPRPLGPKKKKIRIDEYMEIDELE